MTTGRINQVTFVWLQSGSRALRRVPQTTECKQISAGTTIEATPTNNAHQQGVWCVHCPKTMNTAHTPAVERVLLTKSRYVRPLSPRRSKPSTRCTQMRPIRSCDSRPTLWFLCLFLGLVTYKQAVMTIYGEYSTHRCFSCQEPWMQAMILGDRSSIGHID